MEHAPPAQRSIANPVSSVELSAQVSCTALPETVATRFVGAAGAPDAGVEAVAVFE